MSGHENPYLIISYITVYLGAVIFLITVVVRFMKIQNLPRQLRWELYPVAHEDERVKHGGSYMEDLEWWKKPRVTSLVNELTMMIPEMLFLAALYEHNRKLWYRSFPFHFGLYLLIGAIVFLIVDGIFVAAGVTGGLYTLVQYASQILAIAGLVLALLGTLGLIQHRLFDPDIKRFSSSEHIVNLMLFLVVSLVVGFAVITDPKLVTFRSFFHGLVTFHFVPVGSNLTLTSIILTALLIVYVPMTHMFHFVSKWFTYHKIRWDDEPNEIGSDIEKEIRKILSWPVTWSAEHINADGKKSWAELATEEIKKDGK
jgi:nitrate reductase gamma subunit